jgi:hypothetical protein
MEEGRELITRSLASNFPANCFIVLDTHANTHNGQLQWAGGVTAPQTADASEVVTEFCGADFLRLTRDASNAAMSSVCPPEPGWYSDSPYIRGGWRGLFVASCGPAVRHPAGFRDLKRMVTGYVCRLALSFREVDSPAHRDIFDFVMAFAGSSTISTFIKTAISQAIEGMGVDKSGNIWETISRVVARDINLLHTNTVVLIYREREGAREVKSRQIGLHYPPMRAWGFEFTACGNDACRPSPYDFSMKDNESGTRIVCRLCGWASTALKIKDVEGLFVRLSSTVPNVFWHEYPPSAELQDVFVRITKSRSQ